MNSCVYSSFIFLMNSMLLYKKYYYSLSFKIIFLTSVVFHSNRTLITFLIDQLAILNIILYDLYYLYNTLTFSFYHCILLLCVVLCFIISVILFCYGYLFKCFCYDPVHSDYYHSWVHYLFFLGHMPMIVL